MNQSGFAPPPARTTAPDLFGHDPATDPLALYRAPDPTADIFAAAPDVIAASWTALAAGLVAQSRGDAAILQAYVDRQVEELGLAFRFTGDENERAWPLNPMPIVIGAGEWEAISAGLVQRAQLLEMVIADIYGAQELVKSGNLPAAVISGSEDFTRRMVGITPRNGHYLQVIAVDLARGPSGQWRVLADRARLPVGIGYALENRLAMTRTTGGLLPSIGTRSHGAFLNTLRQGLAAACERSDPRLALLTPGRFNQAYPEQANLARMLGMPLVEGRDLVVRDNRLYLRTIAGTKRIDGVWRWIRTRDLDPMNVDARSQIGVPGLINACEDGLVVANWPGAGVVESRAMAAFLPRLSKVLRGEALVLPNVATWWCGGEAERAQVLANLDNLVISSSFRQSVPGLPQGHSRAGSSLSPDERAAIEQGMALRPMDYTAQEIVRLSTTPTLADGRFEPRGFTLRAFLCRDASGEWVVMPGGFARVSKSGDLRTSLMGSGDISTDVCIVRHEPPAPVTAPPLPSIAVRREQGVLTAQAADNLYWLGRYGERAYQTTRTVRTMLEQVAAVGLPTNGGTAITKLCDLLRRLGAAPPASTGWQPSQVAAAALGDTAQAGSIAALSHASGQIALLLRDRLTRDIWRLVHRPLPRIDAQDPESLAICCDELIERQAALSRLTAEGLNHAPSWRFLDLGIGIERAAMALQAVDAIVPGSATAQDLTALLDLQDSQGTYHWRYLALPTIAPVLDMTLLDPAHPRGLAFQLARIEKHLADLPALNPDGLPEPQLVAARLLRAQVAALKAEKVDRAMIARLRDDLRALSDAIGARYFLPGDQPAPRNPAVILD
jgi:uncharacterized circularly permuted ATP-grasp superfamily protein/uncharacterized alpha-E superfamily protein